MEAARHKRPYNELYNNTLLLVSRQDRTGT